MSAITVAWRASTTAIDAVNAMAVLLSYSGDQRRVCCDGGLLERVRSESAPRWSTPVKASRLSATSSGSAAPAEIPVAPAMASAYARWLLAMTSPTMSARSSEAPLGGGAIQLAHREFEGHRLSEEHVVGRRSEPRVGPQARQRHTAREPPVDEERSGETGQAGRSHAGNEALAATSDVSVAGSANSRSHGGWVLSGHATAAFQPARSAP